MRLSQFEIDIVETCAHRVPLDVECEACENTRHPMPCDERDEASGRIISRFSSSVYMRCAHGRLIPLSSGQFTLGNVTKYATFCGECERQRADGRAQDEAIKALCKSLGRPKRVPKRHRAAYDAAHAAWLRGELSDFGTDADGVWTTTEERKAA